MAGRDSVTFVLDTPEAVPRGYGEWLLKGWCFPVNPADKIAIKVLSGNLTAEAHLGLARPDVAQHFNNPDVSHCGFVARFRVSPPVQFVSVVAEVNGETVPLNDSISVASYSNSPSRSQVRSYLEWIRLKEPELVWPPDEISRRLSRLTDQPLISIVLSVSNPDLYLLSRSIESVCAQNYGSWELIIKAEEPLSQATGDLLSLVARRDSRVKLQPPGAGKFIIFLGEGDELSPYALLELVRAMNENPEGEIFYSDSDEVNEWGLRSRPLFKPDLDLDLVLSSSYFGNMTAIKRSRMAEPDSSLETAQPWAQIIRAAELLPSSAIRHIGKVLYHRRASSEPYSLEGARKVLEDYAKRTEKKLKVSEGLFPGSMRIRYEAPREIELGVFLRPEDGSWQSSVVQLNARGRKLHLNPTALPSGAVMVFFNGPLECLNHLFFEELIAQARRAECGLVTGISINTGNQIISSGLVLTPDDQLIDPYVDVKFRSGGYLNQLNLVRGLDSCTETFFAARVEMIQRVGGFAAITSNSPQMLARKLSIHAIENDLRILFTPYAIATFSKNCPRPAPQQPSKTQKPRTNRINPQLFSFEQVDHILKGNREGLDG